MDRIKHGVDAMTLSATVATLAGWLPSIAALVSIVWGVIRIIETKTVQSWIGNRRCSCGKEEA